MTKEEAIKQIKAAMPYMWKETKDALVAVIPELYENEDEKIRKRIRLCLDECVHSDIIRDYERDECLAYLEKRKEPLTPTESYMKGFSEGVEAQKEAEEKPTPDWMPKFLDELRSKKNYFDWDEHRDIEGEILAIINWIAPDYFNRKEKERRDYNKLFENVAKSEWFKKAHEGKSLGGDDETEEQKVYREGKSAGREEVFNHPEEYGLKKLDDVF